MSFSRLPKRLSATLLAGLFALAVWKRFHLPQTPLADPDAWCYVNPGLSKLLGGAFQHTYGQCFLYPGLIYLVLAACGDWRAITVVQHLFGLGTGGLLLVVWRQVRGFLPAPRLPRFLFDLAGLAMAGVYLLGWSPIRFEHTLRPEAVFPFFAVLTLCLDLTFIRHRFGVGTERARGAGLDWRGLATGAGAVFACVMAFLLKPSFSAMLLLANVPVAWSLFAAGRSWRDKLTLALVSVLAPGLLLILPERHFRRGDPDAHSFLAVSLFTVHAGLIRDQMADDLTQHRTAPYDPAWLGGVEARLTREIQASAVTRKYPSLGFDPDFLKLETSFNGWLVKEISDRERAADFYDDYYRRTWRGRPLAMGRKIWRELRSFYQFGTCPAYREHDRFDLRQAYVESAAMFDPGTPGFDRLHPHPASNLAKMNRYLPARDYLVRCEALGTQQRAVATPAWAETVSGLLSLTYLPLCGWALLLGAAVRVLPWARRWAGGTAGVLLLLYAGNFGTTLSLSIGHTMDVGRYSKYQLAYTLLPQAASALLVVEAALAVGALLAVHYGAWFAARPEPLPALGLPLDRGLAVGCPAPGQVIDDLPCDVWLSANDETARRLVRAYTEAPADLITVHRVTDVGPVAGFVRWAVEVEPGATGAGGRLLSERLRRSLPAGASAREVAVFAAGRGFSIREMGLPEENLPGTRPPTCWRETVRLVGLCCRCRPWRVLGMIAAICLGLAVVIPLASLHHPAHAQHRYVFGRGPVRVAGGLAAVAAGSLLTAGILEARSRRWRAAFLRSAGN